MEEFSLSDEELSASFSQECTCVRSSQLQSVSTWSIRLPRARYAARPSAVPPSTRSHDSENVQKSASALPGEASVATGLPRRGKTDRAKRRAPADARNRRSA